MIELTHNDIMLDLETMGTAANSAIVAIGAVRVGRDGDEHEFYRRVDLTSGVSMGLTIDPETVKWWLRQGDVARREVADPFALDQDEGELIWVLQRFKNWALMAGPDPVLWGNGVDFDNAILANAYQACAMEQPWKLWNNRCFRTVRALFPDVEYNKPIVPHHALFDARVQARNLLRIVDHIREREPAPC